MVAIVWHPPPSKMTLVIKESDLAFIGTPKCASTSIRRAMCADAWNFTTQDPADALSVNTRLSIVREPIDRLFSAWNYGWSGMPFAEWWPLIKENPERDIHTYRQSRWIAAGDPTEIYRLDEWADWWPDLVARYPALFPKVMPWRNYVERAFDLADYREFHEDILEVYAEDVSLYNRLTLDKNTENEDAA